MTEVTRPDSASTESPRRQAISILCSDLSESTRFSGTLETEDYSELLGRLASIFHRVIADHGGEIVQITGDGVTAIFGLTRPREDDTRRAVEAALDLRSAVRALGDGHACHGLAPRLHSGVHAGNVLVIAGDDVRGRWEVHGQATNIAKRLSDAAGPDEILVSDAALGPERHLFYTGAVRNVRMKGKDEVVPSVPILGRTPENSRYVASKRAGLTPFFGRKAELQHLSRRLGEVIAGGSLFLKIVGAPGEGKTRLAEELLGHAADRLCLIHRGRCDAMAEPLRPFLEIARSVFGIGENMSPEESASRLEQSLAAIDPALFVHRRAFLHLLGLAEDKGKAERARRISEVEREAGRSVAALRALVEKLAGLGPLILFIDDWHAADDASRAMRAALRGIAPLLILATARPDELQGEIDDAELLPLSPLSAAETVEAATALLRSDDPFLLAQIRDSTGGTPLFIEEMCHSIEAGQTDPMPSDRMAWLRTLIRSRLSRLPEDQADLVRTAAIIGNTIASWLFARVCGLDPGDPIVFGLAEQDFIYPGERLGTLRFKHGLTREVVYESIGPRDRAVMHMLVARALQSGAPELGEEEPVEALAYHFTAAGDDGAAAHYAELAGDKALASSALDRAQLHYGVALDALARSPRDEGRWERVAAQYFRAGVFDPSPHHLPIFRRAVERAEARGDAMALARSHYWLGYINYALGEPLAAIACCERALQELRAPEDDPLAVQIRATLGQAKAAAADYDGALALLDDAIAIKRRHLTGREPPIGLAYSLSCKGFALGDMGRFEDAQACFAEAMAAIRGRKGEVEVSVLNQHAVVCLWQRRFDEARRLAEEGMAAAEQVHSHYSHAMSRSIRAFACWSIDRPPAAVQTIAEATAWLEAGQRGQFTSLNHGWLAEMMVAEGRFADALRFAKRAVRRARKRDRLGEAMALRALARRAAKVGGARPPAWFLDCAISPARARQSPHELAATAACRAELGLPPPSSGPCTASGR